MIVMTNENIGNARKNVKNGVSRVIEMIILAAGIAIVTEIMNIDNVPKTVIDAVSLETVTIKIVIVIEAMSNAKIDLMTARDLTGKNSFFHLASNASEFALANFITTVMISFLDVKMTVDMMIRRITVKDAKIQPTEITTAPITTVAEILHHHLRIVRAPFEELKL